MSNSSSGTFRRQDGDNDDDRRCRALYRLQPLGGEDPGKCVAGVTILHAGIPHEIVLGEELSERDKGLVLAHETGHAFYDTFNTGLGGRARAEHDENALARDDGKAE